MQVSIIGLDIAKNVFHLVGQDQRGKTVLKKCLRRRQVLSYFAQLAPCWVGIEACGGAHHWARELVKLGHRVELLNPRDVKGFVTGSKNDYNDASGICQALRRDDRHSVAVKTLAQQDVAAIHRQRCATLKARTALANRVRAYLLEYGLVEPVGIKVLRRRLPELLEDADNGLSALARELLAEQYEELVRLDERMRDYDRRLRRLVRSDEVAARLFEARGFGPVLATAVPAHIGHARQFANGRGFAASIGVVPHHYGSGGKIRLYGISKRGNRYLRNLFINGARAVLAAAEGAEDRLSRWALAVKQRRGFNVAVVALANKLARIAWAIIARGERYDPARA